MKTQIVVGILRDGRTWQRSIETETLDATVFAEVEDMCHELVSEVETLAVKVKA